MSRLPAFRVEKLPGTKEETFYKYAIDYLKDVDGEYVRDEHGRKIIQSKRRVEYVEERDAGWMVYFPRGESVRIRTRAEMERLGLFDPAKIVDVDSEMEDDNAPQRSRRRRTKAATGAVDANVGGE